MIEHLTPSLLFSKTPVFLRGVGKLEDLPPLELPEIAFAGRSNVGKSSLINSLFNRSDIARTSNTPGRTQQLNFFQLEEAFIFVDMPGYGYAKASKTMVDSWNMLLRIYLKGRATLKRVYLLIDSRHGLKENDREMMKMLDVAAVSYQLVLTKGDYLKAEERAALRLKILEELKSHTAAYPELIATSSRSKEGIEEMRLAIWKLAFNAEIANDEDISL